MTSLHAREMNPSLAGGQGSVGALGLLRVILIAAEVSDAANLALNKPHD